LSRDDRQKASDVFRDTNYVFSSKVAFSDAFPEVREARVKVVEQGHTGSWSSGDSTRSFSSLRGLGEYIDCSNPLCYNGGFSVGSILREMVPKRETHQETTTVCQGYEGSPKGRRRYRSCINYFTITVDVDYVNEGDLASPAPPPARRVEAASLRPPAPAREGPLGPATSRPGATALVTGVVRGPCGGHLLGCGAIQDVTAAC
jgi:hypothetical protein